MKDKKLSREDLIAFYKKRGWTDKGGGKMVKKLAAEFKLQGSRKFQGLGIAVENKKGSVRKWYDPHGKEKGSTKMYFDYGYIRGTKGTDGDHVDVYVGPNRASTKVFIVDQMKKPEGSKRGDGKKWADFDEQKVMLGFDSAEDAKDAYLRQYNDPRFFGKMSEMTMDDFKVKVLNKANHGKAVTGGTKVARRLLKLAAEKKTPLKKIDLEDGEDVYKKTEGKVPEVGERLLLGKSPMVELSATNPDKVKASTLIANPNDPLHTPPGYRKEKRKKAALGVSPVPHKPHEFSDDVEREEKMKRKTAAPFDPAKLKGKLKELPTPQLTKQQVQQAYSPALVTQPSVEQPTAKIGQEMPIPENVLQPNTPNQARPTKPPMPIAGQPPLAQAARQMKHATPPPAGQTLAKAAMASMKPMLSGAGKKTNWNLPFKPPSVKEVAKKPFSSMAKAAFVSDPAAAVGDAAIGGLVGTASGHLTGRLLGKYPGQSRDYGARGGTIAGTLSHLAGGGQSKAVRMYKDVAQAAAMPRGARASEVARALGRGALSYSPEAAAGALGAALMARKRPKGQERKAVKLLAKGQDKKALKAAKALAQEKQSALDVGTLAIEHGASEDGVAGAIIAGEKLAGIVGTLGKGVGKFVMKHKKPIATAGALAGIGAAAYGGKKAIDWTANKAQHGDHRQPMAIRRQKGMGHGIIGR